MNEPPEVGEVTTDLIDGAELLNQVYSFLSRYVAYPSEDACIAHALWIVHTHMMERWESTPRIAFLSPEPGSGKTRALEVTEPLVPRPVEAVNTTSAYLFRKASDPEGLPTILFDEIDTIFGPKAKENEEIRGMINSGHRRGAMAGRCVVRGAAIGTEEFPAYCAVALAGLGDLPDTIISRSVVVRMRRRAPNETVEPYRRRINRPEGDRLRERIELWTDSLGDLPWPDMPDGVEDRNADVWESLLTVADAAGAEWPRKARVAAVALVALAMDSTPSLGIRLLADLKKVFSDHEVLSTVSILESLTAMDEAPWGDLHAKPIDSRGLARRLKPYGVTSKVVRIGEKTPRGYSRKDLWDVWERYLPKEGCCTSNEQHTTDCKEVERMEEGENSTSGMPAYMPATFATSATSATDCRRCAEEGCVWCHSEMRTKFDPRTA